MSKNSKKKIYQGFTLAETLIAMAIVGVIASMTIPVLIHDYDDRQLTTRWKKQFSNVNQAMKLLFAQKGSINFTSDTTFRDDIGTVVNLESTGPWNNLHGKFIYYYKSNTAGIDTAGWNSASAVTLDGSTWRFIAYGNDCPGSSVGLNGICGDIIIDVNSTKPPNEIGKDLYYIHLVRNSSYDYDVYPFGSHGDGKTCEANAGDEDKSSGCSVLALTQPVENMP